MEIAVPPGPAASASGRRWVTPVVVTVVALLPVVAVLVTRTGRNYFPVNDRATIDLFVRDVFSANPPLVGAYSRGFNHPGPMLFWVLAPFNALAGGAPWATLIGSALLQGVGIVAVAWISFRRGSTAFTLVMLAALGLAYTGLAPGHGFLEPWNPFAAFPFFVFFLLEVWAFATGDRWQALGAVVAGTFVVQAHVGYVPLVLAALAWGVVVAVVDRRRFTDGPQWPHVLAWIAGVSVVLWAAPVVQQLTGRNGNLTAMWNFFRSGDSVLGLRRGARLFAEQFAVVPPWLGGDTKVQFGSVTAQGASTVWLIVPALLLGVGFVAARRSGRRADRRLVELATVAAVAALLALSRIAIDPDSFLFYWRISIAVFVVAASSWAVANALRIPEQPTAARAGAAVLVGVIAVTFGFQAGHVLAWPDRVTTIEAASESMMDQVRAHGDPRGPVLVRALGSTAGGFDQGLIDALDRDDAPVKVDEKYGYHFGDHRTARQDEVDEVWYVSEDGRFRSLLPQEPGARLVASSTPLRPAEERELQRLQRDAAAALTAAGRDDLLPALDNVFVEVLLGAELDKAPIPGLSREMLARMAALNVKVAKSGSCRCAIVAFPAARAPDLPYTLG